MPKIYGTLNDVDIVKAVKRQTRYFDLWSRNAIGKLGWLGQRELKRLKLLPRIHITDFDSKPGSQGGPLGTNSYNLRLAPKLLTYKLTQGISTTLRTDGCVPFLDSRKKNPTEEIIIPPEGYMLMPGTLYLGSTVEYTETYNLVPNLDGRSSTGRLGMFIHVTAGRGDVAFCGRWTCEILVVHPLRIYPGDPLLQITYNTIRPGGAQYAGRYQRSTDVMSSRFYLGDKLITTF